MAKKTANQKNNKQAESNSLDMSKGFSTGAFAGLKNLQDIRKAEAEDKKEDQNLREKERIEAQEKARKAAQRALQLENLTGKTAYRRFTEEDITDTSNLSDEEIFAQSVASMGDTDLYTEKFNKKEQAIPKKEQKITMTDEEKEFALFTQEMAVTQVQTLAALDCKKKKKANRIPNEPIPKKIEPTLSAAPDERANDMKTEYLDRDVTVTQLKKGSDVVQEAVAEAPSGLTDAQDRCLREIRKYQERFGALITLKLRGLALSAATQRFDEFLRACQREHKKYALIICGKGLGSQGEPVIKNMVIERLKADDRIAEYVPILNEDGDFGSVYAVFHTK